MSFVIRPRGCRGAPRNEKAAATRQAVLVRVAEALRKAFAHSRFCSWHGEIRLHVTDRTVEFAGVRLRRAKPYCGGHPGPCRAEPGRRTKRLRFLEGADWVEFDDLVNDVLDRLGVEARVSSTSCVLRRGRFRRIRYGMVLKGAEHWDWDRAGAPQDYADHVGRAAGRSEFPGGTPGGDDGQRAKRAVMEEFAAVS